MCCHRAGFSPAARAILALACPWAAASSSRAAVCCRRHPSYSLCSSALPPPRLAAALLGRGWQFPLSPIAPCHQQGLWVVWVTHLCPWPLLPKSRKTNERQPHRKPHGLCARWALLLAGLLPALLLGSPSKPGAGQELRASPCHCPWHLGRTPWSGALGALGSWVKGACRVSRALLRAEPHPELWRVCNIHRLCRAQRRAAPVQRLCLSLYIDFL